MVAAAPSLHSPKGTIMTDTAQPTAAAESGSLDDAALAFKMHLGQAPDDRPRDERGRYAPGADDEPFVAEDDPDEQGAHEAAIDMAGDDGIEAADEAQPDPINPPASWGKDDGDWASLPPATQAKIAAREGQREAAVNQKFQEAANVRRANEALITQAQASRDHAVSVIDHVAQLIIPERPPSSMLNPQSGDYNPDAYHLLNAQFSEGMEAIQLLGQQRQDLVAQHTTEAQRIEQDAIEEIERVARPALMSDVPDLADARKRPAILGELVDYAVRNHIPPETFAPDNAWRVSSAELRILWKASQYDKQKAAQARIRSEPRPAPRAQPAVRPGVATPRAAHEQARFKGSMERLSREGSVEAGAAVFKHFMKGR